MELPPLTMDDMLAQARGNWLASYVNTIGFLKNNGYSIAEWGAYLGRQYAPNWDERKADSAIDLARSMTKNPRSVGGKIHHIGGDAHAASVSFELPIMELVERFGITVDDFDEMVANLYGTMLANLDADFSSSDDGAIWTFTFTK